MTSGSKKVIYAALIDNSLISVTKFFATAYTGYSAMAEELVKNLKKLNDGWSGDESIAPNEVIINKLEEILFTLQLNDKYIPSVQVDEDGTITMYWDVDEEIQCSIDILRNGKTVCIYTRIGENSSESKVVKTTNKEDILNFYNTYCTKQEEKNNGV